ncbi:hypothetical protein Dda_2383 [Drechslerella dactyloides]|uniref:C2H2-type domain-containing protein n=1 Tax=Drechslerella dactyloides TaxID=74499 RepID=A0AAD6J4B4_DREDA|nr:hypothetical protein Dda_2383 [Drechslerella dactyloides]
MLTGGPVDTSVIAIFRIQSQAFPSALRNRSCCQFTMAAEVAYPLAFTQDYAYLGMPKRKAPAFDVPHNVDDAAQDYGILDETFVFKPQQDTYMSTPRTSQPYSMDIQLYEENHQPIQYGYSTVETASTPAGYADHTNSVYMPSPEHSLHSAYRTEEYGMSPTSLPVSSVPMQHQLSHESVQYYHTPISSTGSPDSTMLPSTQSLSDAYNIAGALPASYAPIRASDAKPISELGLVLQRTTDGRITKPKRQFTTAKDAIYTCLVPNCGKHFKRIWNYKAHQDTHNPNRSKPFQCSVASCGKSFVRKTDKDRHETCVHSKKKEFRCRLCNSMFARKDTLRRHEDDGCSKRTDFPKTKPKKRRSPVIPNREPNPGPMKVSPSRNSSRKSSTISRSPMEAQILNSKGSYKLDLE